MNVLDTPQKPVWWSWLLLPLYPFLMVAAAFLAGPIWLMLIPFDWYQKRKANSIELDIQSRMRTKGRLLESDQLNQINKGTLIIDVAPATRFARIWWTADDLYALCPHPISRFGADDGCVEKELRKFAKRCYAEYLDQEHGSGYLVVDAAEYFDLGSLDQSRAENEKTLDGNEKTWRKKHNELKTVTLMEGGITKLPRISQGVAFI